MKDKSIQTMDLSSMMESDARTLSMGSTLQVSDNLDCQLVSTYSETINRPNSSP